MKLTITKKHMFNIPAYVNILYINSTLVYIYICICFFLSTQFGKETIQKFSSWYTQASHLSPSLGVLKPTNVHLDWVPNFEPIGAGWHGELGLFHPEKNGVISPKTYDW